MGFDLQTDVLPCLECLLQEPCNKYRLQHFPESTRKFPGFEKDKVIFLCFFLYFTFSVSVQEMNFKLFITISSQDLLLLGES